MPIYVYKGRRSSGQIVTGEHTHSSADEVAESLRDQGIIPLEIKTRTQQLDALVLIKKKLGLIEQLKHDDLIFFTRQMATLLRANVPLMQSLEGLAQTTPNPVLTKTIRGIITNIDDGHNLTQSLSRYPNIFSSLYINLVQIGETTGKLPEVFKQMADYLAWEKETRTKIKSALRYPIIVLVAIAIGLGIINVFVVPKFANMFAKLGADLPLPTQILMVTSEFMINNGALVIAGIILCALAFLRYKRSEKGRRHWDEKKMRIPIFGRLMHMATIARFTKSLALTVRAGVPIEQAFHVVGAAVDNYYVGEKIHRMRVNIQSGESVTVAAEKSGLFPPMTIQMISVGEESGMLDEMLSEVGSYYEEEIRHSIDNLSASIEPIMITLIGAMVATMAVGIFLPMWDMLGAMKK